MISGFALFPGGATGAGLLILRFSVAASLLALSASYSLYPSVFPILAILAALSLGAGFGTRVVCGLSLSASLFGVATSLGFSVLAALHLFDALALILTGPGAWSVDAVLFGRRVVTLPDRHDTIV